MTFIWLIFHEYPQHSAHVCHRCTRRPLALFVHLCIIYRYLCICADILDAYRCLDILDCGWHSPSSVPACRQVYSHVCRRVCRLANDLFTNIYERHKDMSMDLCMVTCIAMHQCPYAHARTRTYARAVKHMHESTHACMHAHA